MASDTAILSLLADELVALTLTLSQGLVTIRPVHDAIFALVLLEEVTIVGACVAFIRIYPAFYTAPQSRDTNRQKIICGSNSVVTHRA